MTTEKTTEVPDGGWVRPPQRGHHRVLRVREVERVKDVPVGRGHRVGGLVEHQAQTVLQLIVLGRLIHSSMLGRDRQREHGGRYPHRVPR